MFAQPINTRSTPSRMVGWALLFFILYGTTVEAAHKHGGILPTAASATSVAQTQNVDGSAGNKTNCSDCLICQLHQNFSATLISLRLHAAASDPQTTTRQIDPVSIASRVDTPRSGRAPPKVN